MIQVTVNGVIAGAIIALIAIGFAIRYRVEKFIDMSLPVVFTSGAYGAIVGVKLFSLPLFLSIAFGIVTSCLIGVLFEVLLWARLRGRVSPFVQLIASLGLYSIGLSTLSMAFGADIQSLTPPGSRPTFAVLNAQITDLQAVIVLSGVGIITLVTVLLGGTLFGKKIRALSCDLELATACGAVNSATLISVSILTSSILGFAGILFAVDLNMEPTMGLRPYLWGIVAAIGGGLRSVGRITLTAVVLGILMNFGGWFLGAKWQDSIALLVMVCMFLFYPRSDMRRNLH